MNVSSSAPPLSVATARLWKTIQRSSPASPLMVIGALISGFNKGISDMLASLGPKTFWVGRYWGGQNDEDPEDPNPWRRRPPITVEEANRLAQLPTIAFVVVVIGGLGSFWGVVLAALLVGVVRGITIHFVPAAGEASMYVLMLLVLLFRPRGLLGERIERFE